ncbi:hypothetical protein HW555_009479 [Spodoptera exigua]|uniref:Odorant receptor n=1 Tax=Spodoptera exigua TaxID=7107 RepID=A0A835GCZ1_SPOEX|nr:hypothetical protein HW555_009479 [Spodoptera exigua]
MKILSEETIEKYSKTIGDRNEVDKLVILPLCVQDILGHNVLNPKWKWTTRIPQQLFLVFLIVYVILGTNDYLKDATDINDIGEAYYTFIIILFFPIKYMLFIQNRFTLRQLYAMAKTTLLDMIKSDADEKLQELFAKIKLAVKILFGTVFWSISVYFMVAMWNYVQGTRVTLSKSTTTLMPMTSPYYELGLAIHTVFLFEMAFTYCVIDFWFVLLMFSFCTAIDSTINRLKIEGKKSDETDEQYMDRLNDALRIFYKNHSKIMEFLYILSETYKWPSIIPILGILLAFCLILLCMSVEVHWMFLSNLIPTTTELFAYNWFGDQVKDKGTALILALSEFDWPNMRNKDKKNYLIMVSYMNKEFRIKTALGYDLSLVTMSSVFKASYQTFAVLKTVDH